MFFKGTPGYFRRVLQLSGLNLATVASGLVVNHFVKRLYEVGVRPTYQEPSQMDAANSQNQLK